MTNADEATSHSTDRPKNTGMTSTSSLKFESTPDTVPDVCSNRDTRLHQSRRRRFFYTSLILLTGCFTSGVFLTLGIVQARREQTELFDLVSRDFTTAVQDAWAGYELYGLWIHESCRYKPANKHTLLGICSRQEFRELYEYIVSMGLDFQSAQFVPNVTHVDRSAVEAEAREFYEDNYPHVNYRGFVGLEQDQPEGELSVSAHGAEPFYFPIHYVEPVVGNEAAIHLDLYGSVPSQRNTIERATSTWKPALSNRLRLVQETHPYSYSIVLHHPGLKLSTRPDLTAPVDMSLMVIRIPALIHRAAYFATATKQVYIYDSSHEEEDVFLGAATVHSKDTGGVERLEILRETKLTDLPLKSNAHIVRRTVEIADRVWTIAVVSVDGTFQPDILNTVLIAAITLFSTMVLAISFSRIMKLNQSMAQAEQEKATFIVDTARQQAAAERQLNEYIAHEVRNPLSSAMAALSFVSAATRNTGDDSSIQESLRDDITIIEASLQFINELLRNMLDMHRAASKLMKITMAPTDILRDVFEPVAAVLYLRGNRVKVDVDCPSNLVVESDRLRLKQIVLNLAVNSSKFVEYGFIRLRATVNDNNVMIFVEDSGPGIPTEKRGQLFAKFQESLDLLNQGTGIGLCLCKHLTDLMGGDIWLDETYDSGVEGYPGSGFVLDLKVGPLSLETDDANGGPSCDPNMQLEESEKDASNEDSEQALPEALSVMFVDDDLVLRKMFHRSLKRVCPTWTLQEAANGEAALRLVESKDFDLIFIDQYMASVNKQLLGTETVRALRAKGVSSVICGLSANDMEDSFQDAGSDAFMFKPFPCEKKVLQKELARILVKG